MKHTILLSLLWWFLLGLCVKVEGATHKLTIAVSPYGSGYVNFDTKDMAEGENVNLYASTASGFKFKRWANGDQELSKEPNYRFTMGKTDVTLTAVFEYDPTNPGNPDVPKVKHLLELTATPAGGGSFNQNSGRYAEGDSIPLTAYANNGYVFKEWQKDGKALSTDTRFGIRMGTKDIKLTGVFEYSPTNPDNPAKNYWNAATGEAVIDDFKPGQFSKALDDAIGGYNNRDKVLSVIASGSMNTYDLDFLRNYKNCAKADLSRTYGYNELSSYFGSEALTEIILPAGVGNIADYALYKSKNLTSLTLYAMEPPKLSANSFNNETKGNINVFVIPAALPLYSEADGWKNMTLLPLAENVRNITVQLPADAKDGRYKGMTIELQNIDSKQTQRLLITDRTRYTFGGIVENTRYTVAVKNAAGTILGAMKNVTVGKEDVTVNFTALKQPQNVVMKVTAADGADLSPQARIQWLSADGSLLGQSTILRGQVEGTSLRYRMELQEAAGLVYAEPGEASYVVKASDNTINVVLDKIAKKTITGTVKDASTKQAVAGATVTVAQKLNGKYDKTSLVTANAAGAYTTTVAVAPTNLTFTASGYISQTVELGNNAQEKIKDVLLNPISGVTVNTSFTYTPSVAEGETATTQTGYSDVVNVTYNVKNLTTGETLTNISAQYPMLVIMSGANIGDKLQIVATSTKEAFSPVTVETTVDEDQTANAVFNVKEPGRIQATYHISQNEAVVGMLYNADGQLVKIYPYSEAAFTTAALPDGDYTLVSMGKNTLFNNMLNKSALASAGLKAGTDYVENAVEVKSGLVTQVKVQKVPIMDETKASYTTEGTLFTVNRTSIVVGNYLTLKGRIAFKDEYADKVGQVQMVVDLPTGAEFVENSVMAGNKIVGYTVDKGRITIPLTNFNDEVRFCIVPTTSGNYAPAAMAEFTLNDRKVTQPIGNAPYAAKSLSITVPRTVSKSTITISGTAQPLSMVKVMDGNTLIGQTSALANGQWNATCELDHPYNLSTHLIRADVTTKQGYNIKSETGSCLYDEDVIEPKSVKMTFYNGYYNKNITVDFDFQTGRTSSNSYIFYSKTDFTFIVDLNNNDSSKVKEVMVNVFTNGNNVYRLPATYNGDQDRWIATAPFGSELPVNVSVDVWNIVTAKLDGKNVENAYNNMSTLKEDYKKDIDRVNKLTASAQKELDKEKPDFDAVEKMIDQIAGFENQEVSEEELNKLLAMSDAEFEKTLKDFLKEADEACADISKEYDGIDSLRCNYSPFRTYNFKDESGNTWTVEISEIKGLDAEDFKKQGYTQIPVTDEKYVVLEKQADNLYDKLDFTNKRRFKMTLTGDGAKRVAKLDWNKVWTVLKKYQNGIIKGALKSEEDLSKVYAAFDKNKKLKLDIIKRLEDSYSKQLKAINKKLETSIGLKEIDLLTKKADLERKMAKVEGHKAKVNRIPRNVALINDALFSLKEWIDWANEVTDLGDRLNALDVPQCAFEAKPEAAALLTDMINKARHDYQSYYMKQFGRKVFYQFADLALGKLPAVGLVLNWMEETAEQLRDDQFTREFKNTDLPMCEKNLESLKKKCKEPPTDDEDPNKDDDEPTISPFNPITPIHDPSGYVYEAVTSNRLQGVTATCYYKETVEDMYGDKHEEVRLWNAEEYAQQNPLFTNENGMYQWDVPQGMWQVKFEKEGYEPTQSEWLPVPPPQLDVNIAMTQNTEPRVAAAAAYTDGMDITFDKYMMPETMTTDNISVTENGQAVKGTIVPLNMEKSYGEGAAEYVSKVRFTPEEPFSAKTVTLIVGTNVKSYAGLRMQDVYSQTFDVGSRLTAIEADSAIAIAYGDKKEVTVKVVPAPVGAGKTLHVKTTESLIAQVEEEAYTLDKEGVAVITVNGKMPGTVALNYTIDGSEATGQTIVNVLNASDLITATPTASIASGSAVLKGTRVTLKCATPKAVIYYTTDGSCPCDNTTGRKIYNGTPIAIDQDTEIKVMAVAEGLAESEIAVYKYTVEVNQITLATAGWKVYPKTVTDKLYVITDDGNADKITITNASGQTVMTMINVDNARSIDISTQPAGVYLVTINDNATSLHEKVIKVH